MTETWSLRVERSDYVEVGWFCPKQPYLEIQIPDAAASVTRLTITTVSHDQGFSDHTSFHGTYEASCSFFEVAVLSSELHERAITKAFQYNLHASRTPRTHVNIWDTQQDLGEDDHRWLASFTAGDCIQVIPAADFIGWTNHVYEISIEIEGEKRKPGQPELTTLGNGSDSLSYQPLSRLEREVRMLLLYPGAAGDPVTCSIKTVSLDYLTEPYVALSYCWGNPSNRKAVHIRDKNDLEARTQQLGINSNLYEALRHLRSGITEPFFLWADAICINQDDLEERSHQVTLIQTIYKEAQSIIIWLGSPNKTRESCFASIREVEARIQKRLDHTKTCTPDELDQECLKLWVDDIEGDPCMEMSREWRKCDFDWFNRTWVLQEIANAKSATVRCGDDILSWAVVARFADAIRVHKERAPLIRYGIMPTVFLTMTKANRNAKENVKILEVLTQTLGLKASDRRDRIFAMLQFGDETNDMNKIPTLIRPDYGKSVQQVFTDFVRWWICEHKSLRILSMIHSIKGRSWQKMYYGRPTDLENLGYPSWTFWYGGQVSWATGTLALAPDSPYCASGSSIPDVELVSFTEALTNRDVLRVKGYRICDVFSVARYETSRACFLKQWQEVHSHAHVRPGDGGSEGHETAENNYSASHDKTESQGSIDDEVKEGQSSESDSMSNADPFELISTPTMPAENGPNSVRSNEDSTKSESDRNVRLESEIVEVTEGDNNTETQADPDQAIFGDATKIAPIPIKDKNVQAAFEDIFNPTGSARTWIWDKDDRVLQKMHLEQEVQLFYTHLRYHQDGFEGEGSSFSCYSRCRMQAFNAADKHFFGIVPHLARPGDVVVMLNGGPVFYLLREAKSKRHINAHESKNGSVDDSSGKATVEEKETDRKKWVLVGECFLDNMMNGEALQEIQESSIAEEIFDLV